MNLTFFLCAIVLVFSPIVLCLGDPYKILGVGKKAEITEIKKAYKQLAMKWHPDKSDKPEAESKFIEIKQAYELLSDSNRRRAYDLHGITNEDAGNRLRPDYSQYGRFSSDPFEDFFGQNRHNNFNEQDISLFHKLSITTRYYETNVIPKSRVTPHLIMFYSDWCFACMRAAGAFKKMIDSLESLGVVFASINAGHENQLVRKAGVHSLPCIVLVLDEHNYVFKDNVFSVQKVVEFLRQKLPYKLIQTINDDRIDSFLSGWSDNRVRALIFEPRQQTRLRYLLTAYHFKSRVSFGFVQINSESKDTKVIVERYKVHPNMDTLLLFNEDSMRPVASVSMSDIPSQTLSNIISANQYLALPRLSSQGMLEGVCPAEWSRPKKKLCVILVTENSGHHDYARQVLRRIAIESNYRDERVKFAYMFKEKQSAFINSLSINSGNNDTLLKLVIIWRRDTTHIKYEWITEANLHESLNENIGEDEENYNKTKMKIDETIQKLLRSNEAMSFEAEVKDLLDEHSQNLATRIIKKALITIDYFYDSLGKEHILPVLSVVGTVLFILGVGYCMSYLVKVEEETVRKGENETSKKSVPTDDESLSTYVPELRLHELRAEKYNGLIRLLKPGCRTIVLITDMQSRPKLIPGFHKAVWPYRRNKTLMFAHMLIDKGVNWYSELLRLSLTESRDLKINPRNCIGTVIALNGHRKYFCMYHAKHPETSRGTKRMLQMTKTLSFEPNDPEAGAFLGLESDDSGDEHASDMNDPKILLEENLLDGLSNWLDRLFEGSTHRYFVNYWPDFPTK